MKNQKLLLLVALLTATVASAKVTLPQMFQNGMVMQRNQPIPVWGKADAGEHIVLKMGKKQYEGTADADGRWRIDLPKMKAGGPYELRINDLEIKDIMIGDVWLCSGQSNIDVTVERVYPQYTRDIDSYENPMVRLFRVANTTDTRAERDDIPPTQWRTLTKQNAWTFSAVGYFLGRRMQEKTGVAQGIIVNSWGGTPIEAWLSADSLREDFPLDYRKTLIWQNDDMVEAQRRANQLADQRWQQVLNELDPGMTNEGNGFRYTQTDYDDSAWEVVNQYDNNWAKKNGRGLIGTIWLRQHVHVDHAHAGQPARLLLGTLFDCDYTYVNGQEVGRTYYQYPPRRYDIPAGLLHEGDNVITVRFINKYGTVHFIPEKPYLLAFGDDRQSLNPLPQDIIRLSEQWRCRQGVEMPSCPSADVSVQNLPSTLYNAVVHPLAPFGLAGVVWYQGESNTGNPAPYYTYLKKLVTGWRQLWNRPELPFVIVQLANHMAPSEGPQPGSGWARLREAQRVAAHDLPYTQLATAIDLGETVDIHPLLKREMAERIGQGFDRLVYGDQRAPQLPEVLSCTAIGSRVTLTVSQPVQSKEGSTTDGTLYEFELAGSDGHFVNAQAKADGNVITLTSPITQPCRVRHAWKDNPLRLNTYTANGLPLPPFEQEVRNKNNKISPADLSATATAKRP